MIKGQSRLKPRVTVNKLYFQLSIMTISRQAVRAQICTRLVASLAAAPWGDNFCFRAAKNWRQLLFCNAISPSFTIVFAHVAVSFY